MAQSMVRDYLTTIDMFVQYETKRCIAAWDGGMSFIGLSDHLSASADRFLNMVQGQAPGAMPEPSATLTEARGASFASRKPDLSLSIVTKLCAR